MATHSNNRNFISNIAISEDTIVTEHEQKARILWNAYKNRLGISDVQGISYNLSSLLQAQALNCLHEALVEMKSFVLSKVSQVTMPLAQVDLMAFSSKNVGRSLVIPVAVTTWT